MYLRASGREGQPLSLELSNKPFSNPPLTTAGTTTGAIATTTTGPSLGACAETGGVVGHGCTESVLVPASSRPLGRKVPHHTTPHHTTPHQCSLVARLIVALLIDLLTD